MGNSKKKNYIKLSGALQSNTGKKSNAGVFYWSSFHNSWWWSMNECHSECRDMFSLPLIDSIFLNIELYSSNAFLSINSTLSTGLPIWWIARAHNKMHFIMYMWQPHLLLKYLPNTIMLLKSSKINIKSQPQVGSSFLPNNWVMPQLYPNLKVEVFSSSPAFAGNYLINSKCQVHLLFTSEEQVVI